MQSAAQIQAFFDEATNTVTYLVSDPATRQAAVIDPVLDYDHRSGKVSITSADQVLAAAAGQALEVAWILETHAHADHLSAAPYLRARTGARVAIGEHIRDVQAIFRPVFNLDDVPGDGGEFDRLLRDGETLSIGDLTVDVLHTPGHTPACVSYRVGDAVFVGDTLFMPDYGTARRFPGRKCPHPVPIHPETACTAPRDPSVHVPRLQGTRPRQLRLGKHGRRGTRT
jgi:glyoxylase-like metal-dependent hydrolase (beta-lactamase superfamily II)